MYDLGTDEDSDELVYFEYPAWRANVYKEVKMDSLKEQIYDVSNPLDLMLDPEYVRQACTAEEKVGGNIGAGLDWGL